VVELGELRIPASVRPYAEGVVAVTDAVCAEHLDAVYADLCRRLVGKLSRKRPSPLTRGDLRIWAAGVIYCLGQVNFIFDPSQSPHASADELIAWLGVKKSTMANKARTIRESAGVSDFNAEFLRPDVMDSVGLVWLVQVDGMVVDARHLPLRLQIEAFHKGLIPYIPSAGPQPGSPPPA
jgi:Domain of unknown function (DUF6398)